MEIPKKGIERVEWWAEFFRAVADDAYRTGEAAIEEGGDEQTAVVFMEDFGKWLKRGVDGSISEALTFWSAIR